MSETLSQHLADLKSEISDLFEVTTCSAISEDDGLDTTTFLSNLNCALKDLQKKAIFLSLVFLDNPKPKLADITSSTHELRQATAAVSSVSLKRSNAVGKTLQSSWNFFLRNVFRDLIDFVEGLHTATVANDSSHVKTCIGKLCHSVDAFSKLPKSNKQAALVAAKSGLALVEDALEELTAEDFPIRSTASSQIQPSQNNIVDLLGSLGLSSDSSTPAPDSGTLATVSEDGDTPMGTTMPDEFVSLESILSDAEIRQLIQISTGLVKTVKACLKKACTVLSLPDEACSVENEVVDEIIECCDKMSPTCDEFVLALYPPRRARLLESEATDLSAAMKKLIAAISDFTTAKNNSKDSNNQNQNEGDGSSNNDVSTNDESSTSSLLTSSEDKQLEILSKAIDHNTNKLISFLNAQIH